MKIFLIVCFLCAAWLIREARKSPVGGSDGFPSWSDLKHAEKKGGE